MSLSNEIHDCCPFCGGVGFTVYSYRGEPEQEQCQFCYERAYPLADKVKELEAERDRLRETAQDFIDKVDSGKARSKDSYAKFKQALKGET